MFSATYVKSMTMIFTPLFPSVSFPVLSAVLIGIVLLMTLRGGLVAIIQTDVLSFCLLCLFLPVMVFFAWKNADFVNMDSYMATFEWTTVKASLPPEFVESLILLAMFTYILAPWYGQKIFAAKSERIAWVSVFIAALLVGIFYGGAVLAASFITAKGITLGSAEGALPFIVHQWLPVGLKGVAYGVLFAAAATTLSGVLSAMTTMIIGDFLPKKQSQGYTRGLFITLALACTAYILANTLVDNVFRKMILGNIPIFALSFSLLAGFYWSKASKGGAYCSITVGLIWGIGTYMYYGEEGGYYWYWAFYGLPLIFASGILGSYLLPNARMEQHELPQ